MFPLAPDVARTHEYIIHIVELLLLLLLLMMMAGWLAGLLAYSLTSKRKKKSCIFFLFLLQIKTTVKKQHSVFIEKKLLKNSYNASLISSPSHSERELLFFYKFFLLPYFAA